MRARESRGFVTLYFTYLITFSIFFPLQNLFQFFIRILSIIPLLPGKKDLIRPYMIRALKLQFFGVWYLFTKWYDICI